MWNGFMFSFPVVCDALVTIGSDYCLVLVPSSASCVLTSLSVSLGLEHKLLMGCASTSVLLGSVIFRTSQD